MTARVLHSMSFSVGQQTACFRALADGRDRARLVVDLPPGRLHPGFLHVLRRERGHLLAMLRHQIPVVVDATAIPEAAK